MHVITTIFSSGERYPILIDACGVPDFYSTLYETTQLRNAAKSPNTIEANLQAIRLLYNWCQSNQIVLEELFSSAKVLSSVDIESLCYYLRVKKNNSSSKPSSKIILLEKERIRTGGNKIEAVASTTLYIRITYVSDYIEWLAKHTLIERNRVVDRGIHENISRMIKALKARRPTRSITSRSAVKGLSDIQRKVLQEITDESHERNPFPELTRQRDSLLVELMLDTGIRLGEMLAIKISDFNFQENTLLIPRRHDDLEDPRAKQPVAKTMDRILALKRVLAERIHNYILHNRSAVKGASKHSFLFVVYKEGPYCGTPLSSNGVYRIFDKIKNSKEELNNLTPHALRHTWNDMFSEKVDSLGMEEAKEEKLRSFLMGWKEGSGTSAIYTRRHIEKKAREVSLQLQDNNSNDK